MCSLNYRAVALSLDPVLLPKGSIEPLRSRKRRHCHHCLDPSSLNSGSAGYRGPILFNPGGPGGSDVDLVINWGELLSTIVGPESIVG